MDKLEIWKTITQLESQRRRKITQLIEQYDQEHHYPQIQALQEECEKTGHEKENQPNNDAWMIFTGSHKTWVKCKHCRKQLKEDNY